MRPTLSLRGHGPAGSFLLLLAALAAGCPLGAPPGTDPPPTDAGPLPDHPTSCDVSAHVFQSECVRCHAGHRDPDLRAESVAALVGQQSDKYPGKVQVVAGDSAGSFLFTKLHTPGSNLGAIMPPRGALDPTLVAFVQQWIDEGASTDCTPVVDPNPPSDVPVPGAPIDVGPTPCDSFPCEFVSTKPDWVTDATCSTQQWYSRNNNHESPWMHPGRECIACHTEEDEGPRYSYAGTVNMAVDDGDECRGVPGVRVDILNANDVVIGSDTSDESGNFGIRRSAVPFITPYRVRMSYEGRTREMELLTDHEDGDCLSCHTAAGTDDAPGRIVAP